MRLEPQLARFHALQLAHGLQPATVATYRRAIAAFVAHLLGRGKEDLRETTRDDVALHLVALQRRKLASSHVSARLSKLRQLFRFLLAEGLVLEDPTATIHRKRPSYRPHAYLSEPEVKRLLEAPDASAALGLRDRAILELLYSTGLRVGEATALELDDLDLDEGFVTVRTSKTGRGRRVPLGDLARHWTVRYLEDVRPALLGSAKVRCGPSALVFLNRRSGPLTVAAVELLVRVHAARARITKRMTPHVLRHTFAVHLLRHGASTRHIQEMLGHRSLDSTQTYTRLLVKELRRVHRRCHPRSSRGAPNQR